MNRVADTRARAHIAKGYKEANMPVDETSDTLRVQRVANGWVVVPLPSSEGRFTHVYLHPADLAKYVENWARFQTAGLPRED